MNALPLDFYDDVIHRISIADIGRLKRISGYWSSTAGTHFNRRREVRVSLKSNKKGTKVGVKLDSWQSDGPFEIDVKYDRIKSVDLSEYPSDETEEVTLEHLRTKTLPMIRSIASDCKLVFVDAFQPHKQCDIILDGLKECHGLSSIWAYSCRNKGQELIRRQIEFGNLKALCLMENIWPIDFQGLIKVFVKSPKFRILHTNLTLDFDIVTCVFDRFFTGELTVFELRGSPSFPFDDLRSLYPEFAFKPRYWTSECKTVFWSVPSTKKKVQATVFNGKLEAVGLLA
ncbi:hypothetical protein QR680_006999 [Steinernema hermaphroditum]|uniref:F-box domain-containing protein n=1 Tax=Steinernema hermaphroditum TaxID=289476 RepID=A0AA39HX91_9BILA|nr:hypothetical protein QR680_006999 [Steinernema hermaphroditum]